MALRSLSLCAGVGALDLGVAIAVPGSRAVCHVEREAYAAAVLVARMEDASLEPAPIWDCLETFDGRPWRGAVDLITAGFPCQPWSVAGKRGGTADERWIWDDIARIIREAGPGLVLLENVPGLISGGGLGLVLGSLATLGFDAEWGVLKASEVGAPHERERVFILAYSQSLPQHLRGRPGRQSLPVPSGGCCELGIPLGAGLEERGCQCGDIGPECAAAFGAGPFPPGRDDPRWIGILAEYPHLAPAIEPGFRVLDAGVALVLDASRAAQIRCVGNGVVALQAAAAFTLLARRAGIRL